MQKRLDSILSELQCPFKLLEGKSLIHSRDLGFPVKQLPDVFTHFASRWKDPICSASLCRRRRSSSRSPKALRCRMQRVYTASRARRSLVPKTPSRKHLLSPLLDEPVLGHKELLSKVASSSPGSFDVHTPPSPTKAVNPKPYVDSNTTSPPASPSPGASYKETRNQMLGADYSHQVRRRPRARPALAAPHRPNALPNSTSRPAHTTRVVATGSSSSSSGATTSTL